MKRILLIPFLLAAQVITAQEKTIPDEVKAFILPGMTTLDYVAGDLNGDGRPDALLMLKDPLEDSLPDEESIRAFLLLTRGSDNKLKLVFRNDSLLMCRTCGGMLGDPFSSADIIDKGFVLYFYGGSSWRWMSEYHFRYDAAKKGWFLFKEVQGSFQAGDPEKTMKETLIEEAELGDQSAENFSAWPGYDGSKWKVRAAKTFFHDTPKLGTKPRKGFLLKGDEATCIRELKNFVEVSFENNKHVITTGFILKKDLEKL